jgi:hypothetical protein
LANSARRRDLESNARNTMTEAEIKNVAENAAAEALRKFMLVLGVDVSTPAATIELQKDFSHLRQARLTMGAVGNKILMVCTGSAVTFVIGAVGYYAMHGH